MQMPMVLVAAIMFLFAHRCSGEVYTALVEMEELLETEAVLIGNLEAYIDAQEEKLNYLRRFAPNTYSLYFMCKVQEYSCARVFVFHANAATTC